MNLVSNNTGATSMLAQSFAASLAVALGPEINDVIEANRSLSTIDPCPSKALCQAEQLMISCYAELFGRPAFDNTATAELMRDAWALCRQHDYSAAGGSFRVH